MKTKRNTFTMESFRTPLLPERAMNDKSLEDGIILLNISYTNNKLFCIYRRPLSGNGIRADLTINKYAIWAAGDVVGYDDILGHTERGVSDNTVNFRFEKVMSLITSMHVLDYRLARKCFKAIIVIK